MKAPPPPSSARHTAPTSPHPTTVPFRAQGVCGARSKYSARCSAASIPRRYVRCCCALLPAGRTSVSAVRVVSNQAYGGRAVVLPQVHKGAPLEQAIGVASGVLQHAWWLGGSSPLLTSCARLVTHIQLRHVVRTTSLCLLCCDTGHQGGRAARRGPPRRGCRGGGGSCTGRAGTAGSSGGGGARAPRACAPGTPHRGRQQVGVARRRRHVCCVPCWERRFQGGPCGPCGSPVPVPGCSTPCEGRRAHELTVAPSTLQTNR